MRRKKGSIKLTNKKRNICQIIIIFGRFLFSTDGTWRKERSSGGWKVRTRHQGPEGSHCHEKLNSRMSMGWEHLWLVRVECGVYSGWREMMTGELERCGDSSEWVNNPVQLPPGPGSDPGPGTLDCEPGPVTRSPVCLLKRAHPAHGDYRRSKACDDFWSQISPHELYWNPDLRWTLNQ